MLNIYDASLFCIVKELAERGARDEYEQEMICEKWGRTLDNLTEDERAYIEATVAEFEA